MYMSVPHKFVFDFLIMIETAPWDQSMQFNTTGLITHTNYTTAVVFILFLERELVFHGLSNED